MSTEENKEPLVERDSLIDLLDRLLPSAAKMPPNDRLESDSQGLVMVVAAWHRLPERAKQEIAKIISRHERH